MFWIQWLLLKIDPEKAHVLGVFLLRLYQWFRIHQKKIPLPAPVSQIEVSGFNSEIRFRSRLGLAAGFDKQAEVYAALAHLGFGFVEVGTVTPRPQPGNPKPRIWRHAGETLVNHLGFNSVGIDAFERNLSRYRKALSDFPVLANIGKNRDTPNEEALQDFRICFNKLQGSVQGFVVNLSSPNTPGLQNLQEVEFVRALSRIIPAGHPTFIKLSPDISPESFDAICDEVAHNSKVQGLVLINTSRELAQRLLQTEKGGLSGAPLHERAMYWLRRARALVGPSKTLIGVGGVNSLKAASDLRHAGADLVEAYTAFVYRGPEWVKDISRQLK